MQHGKTQRDSSNYLLFAETFPISLRVKQQYKDMKQPLSNMTYTQPVIRVTKIHILCSCYGVLPCTFFLFYLSRFWEICSYHNIIELSAEVILKALKNNSLPQNYILVAQREPQTTLKGFHWNNSLLKRKPRSNLRKLPTVLLLSAYCTTNNICIRNHYYISFSEIYVFPVFPTCIGGVHRCCSGIVASEPHRC